MATTNLLLFFLIASIFIGRSASFMGKMGKMGRGMFKGTSNETAEIMQQLERQAAMQRQAAAARKFVEKQQERQKKALEEVGKAAKAGTVISFNKSALKN